MRTNKRTDLLREPTRQSLRYHSQTQQPETNQDQDTPKSSSSSHPPCVAKLHALPVELLAHILEFCTEVPVNTDHPILSYPVWLPITHVCRHWRTIALSHGPLWISISRGWSLRWIRAFMERSRTMLMDFDIHVARLWPNRRSKTPYDGLYYEDVILLLADFTRIRSLHLTGTSHTIGSILDSLCNALPVHSLSICLQDDRGNFILSDDLFGGQAPIRRLQLDGIGPFVAPHWLLRGVTHFTSSESIGLPQLLGVLQQMSVLEYFEFRGGLYWDYSNVNKVPIRMPQLMNLIIRTSYLDHFILLNQLLSLHVGAKRRLELLVQASWFRNLDWIHRFSLIAEAANGFQHLHLSGAQGCFRLWNGNAVTSWEDAEFCFYVEWRGAVLSRGILRYLVALCDALGAARVRRLAIDSPPPGLLKSHWWTLLERFPGIEELELDSVSVDALGAAWEVNGAPAVLPALRRLRIVNSELDNPLPQYAIIGDPLARRIVRLPNSFKDDVAPLPDSEVLSAEKELEQVSKGLLRFLQGSSGRRRR